MGIWDKIIGGLDGIGQGVETIGDDVARSTGEFVRIRKLKSQIAEEKRTINTQYFRIGKKYYDAFKDDPKMREDPMFCTIRENLEAVEQNEREIAALRQASESARAAQEESAAAQQAAHTAQTMDQGDRSFVRTGSAQASGSKEDFEDEVVDADYYAPEEFARESDFEEE